MPISLSDTDREAALASLRRFAVEELDLDLGALHAGFLLDFVLGEIGPSVYNRALADAQREIAARVADLDVEIGQAEFSFWSCRAR